MIASISCKDDINTIFLSSNGEFNEGNKIAQLTKCICIKQ